MRMDDLTPQPDGDVGEVSFDANDERFERLFDLASQKHQDDTVTANLSLGEQQEVNSIRTILTIVEAGRVKMPDEPNLEGIEERFLALLAEEEPDHLWTADREQTQFSDEAMRALDSFKEHLDARGITVEQLGDAVHVPIPVALSLVRNTLESLPPKLTNRVAGVLDIDPRNTAFIMERVPVSTQVQTSLLRSNTGVMSLPNRRRTFREAMLQCRENGQLTSEQEQDWKEELLP